MDDPGKQLADQLETLRRTLLALEAELFTTQTTTKTKTARRTKGTASNRSKIWTAISYLRNVQAPPLDRQADGSTDCRSGVRDEPGPGGGRYPMIIIWRGWGLLAVAVLGAPLTVCGAHADLPSGLAPVLAGLALAAAGACCWAWGRRWNRGSIRHSLYFVPLQYWGLAYVAVGALFAVAALSALLRAGA